MYPDYYYVGIWIKKKIISTTTLRLNPDCKSVIPWEGQALVWYIFGFQIFGKEGGE
jgi:hypothetical protein